MTAIQFGYWAVLVYSPLFLSAGLLVSIEEAGLALLAATLPMLVCRCQAAALLHDGDGGVSSSLRSASSPWETCF